MVTSASKNSLGSPKEHTPTCEKHNMNIDMICEDCDEFICSWCAKFDHHDHDWNTIHTASRLRRKELQETLSKITEKGVKKIDEKIKNLSQRNGRQPKML